MNRSLAAALMASAVALAFAACDDGSQRFHDNDYFADVPCGSYASCEACTPVVGCGWCYKLDGTGQCASRPDECAASPAFNWTWNPSGCRVEADAAVTLLDGAPVMSEASSPGPEASSPTVVGPLAVDASTPAIDVAAPSLDSAVSPAEAGQGAESGEGADGALVESGEASPTLSDGAMNLPR